MQSATSKNERRRRNKKFRTIHYIIVLLLRAVYMLHIVLCAVVCAKRKSLNGDVSHRSRCRILPNINYKNWKFPFSLSTFELIVQPSTLGLCWSPAIKCSKGYIVHFELESGKKIIVFCESTKHSLGHRTNPREKRTKFLFCCGRSHSFRWCMCVKRESAFESKQKKRKEWEGTNHWMESPQKWESKKVKICWCSKQELLLISSIIHIKPKRHQTAIERECRAHSVRTYCIYNYTYDSYVY